MDDASLVQEKCGEASSAFNKAYNIALRYLSLREYSEKELLTKIIKKQSFDGEVLSEVVKKLREQNYLSEERYIRQKAKLLKIKGYSDSYIITYLGRENVQTNKEVIQSLELSNSEESLSLLIQKKLRGKSLESIPTNKKNTLIRFLASKGYTFEEIMTALKRHTS